MSAGRSASVDGANFAPYDAGPVRSGPVREEGDGATVPVSRADRLHPEDMSRSPGPRRGDTARPYIFT